MDTTEFEFKKRLREKDRIINELRVEIARLNRIIESLPKEHQEDIEQ